MQITFLGTGTSQGIPVIGSQHPVCLSENPRDKRLRVSVMIEWENYRYVIDCGTTLDSKCLLIMFLILMGFYLLTNTTIILLDWMM